MFSIYSGKIDRRVVWVWALLLFTAGVCSADITSILESTRKKYDLPAMAAVVIFEGQVIAMDAVGVRKAGTDVPVTKYDKFHLGSCTKAMTATMIGMLVEQGKLDWDTTLAEAFPEMEMHENYREVTLKHLLRHRAGLRKASWPVGKSFMDMHRLEGNPRAQRRLYVEMILNQEPIAKPGEKYEYCNGGYTVAAMMAEDAMDKPWEELMREMIFEPLGMTSAGFGAMGTPGEIDQPWQHHNRGGKVRPTGPGPYSDNPPVIGPGGTVHCSMGDWAKFVQVHLNVRDVREKLVTIGTLRALHRPMFGGDYACGWMVTKRSWGPSKVLTHNGSNNANFAVVWAAPLRKYAVLVATNQGGGDEEKPCDEVASALIKLYPPVQPGEGKGQR